AGMTADDGKVGLREPLRAGHERPLVEDVNIAPAVRLEKTRVQLVLEAPMVRTQGGYVEYLSPHELDALVLAEDAGLEHAQHVVGREAASTERLRLRDSHTVRVARGHAWARAVGAAWSAQGVCRLVGPGGFIARLQP